MAYTTINKSTEHFNTKLYTGNASSRTISGIGFQPDLTWSKNRGNDDNHYLYDAVRGATKYIISDNNVAESTASGITAWNADGYTLGSSVGINANGVTAVSWNWKAGGGAGSANTDGSINTTSTSVNTTAGFSISTYTGTGSNATVGHGLGVAPKMILIKRLSAADNWIVYHNSLGGTKNLYLDANNGEDTRSDTFNNTAPTSSVFSLGSATGTNGSGQTYVAYCFAEKTGYSKFGSYVGNGNADGTFVYLGFKPHFFLIKRVDTIEDWIMTDSKRGYPQSWNYLLASTFAVEASGLPYDFLSNGVKFRGATQNESGSTYIYMAFGQSIVGSNNVPAVAR